MAVFASKRSKTTSTELQIQSCLTLYQMTKFKTGPN